MNKISLYGFIITLHVRVVLRENVNYILRHADNKAHVMKINLINTYFRITQYTINFY